MRDASHLGSQGATRRYQLLYEYVSGGTIAVNERRWFDVAMNVAKLSITVRTGFSR